MAVYEKHILRMERYNHSRERNRFWHRDLNSCANASSKSFVNAISQTPLSTMETKQNAHVYHRDKTLLILVSYL